MATDPIVEGFRSVVVHARNQGWGKVPLTIEFADELLARIERIRAQAFTEAADKVKAECAHGDMHYGNFDPDRCPICSHFIAAVRGLSEGTE